MNRRPPDFAQSPLPYASAKAERPNLIWLLTFTDLVSLLLAFFVMLFSMSNVKIDDWNNIIDSLSKTLRPALEASIEIQKTSFNIGTVFRREATNLDYLTSVIKENVGKIELLSETRISLLEDRLVIALQTDQLFAAGKAVMTEKAQQAMFVFGGLFSTIGNEITVNGHTDATPPPDGAYASNWELSTGRAAAIANALRDAGYANAIIAFGYGDSMLGKTQGATAAARAAARRVEIVVLPTAGVLSR